MRTTAAAAVMICPLVAATGCEDHFAFTGCEVIGSTPAAIDPAQAVEVSIHLRCDWDDVRAQLGLAAERDGAAIGPVVLQARRDTSVYFDLPAGALADTGGAAILLVRDRDAPDPWYPVLDLAWPVTGGGP